MPNFTGKSGGGPSAMKMYGKGKNPIMMTAAQETLPENLKAGIRTKEAKESALKIKISPFDTVGKVLNPAQVFFKGAKKLPGSDS